MLHALLSLVLLSQPSPEAAFARAVFRDPPAVYQPAYAAEGDVAPPPGARFVQATRDAQAPLLEGCSPGCTPAAMRNRVLEACFDGQGNMVLGACVPANAEVALDMPMFSPASPLWGHMQPLHAWYTRLFYVTGPGMLEPVDNPLEPAEQQVRAGGRMWDGDSLVLVHNSGSETYNGRLAGEAVHSYRLDLAAGTVYRLPADGELVLEPGAVTAFLRTDRALTAQPVPQPLEEVLILDEYLMGRPLRRHTLHASRVAVSALEEEAVPLARSGDWADWLDADFSGEVEYTCKFYIPKVWANGPLRLEAASIAQAATVLIDDEPVGGMYASPWRLAIGPLEPGAHTLTIRVANTLANAAVPVLAPDAKGDPDQEQHLKAAMAARGGGLTGPVQIRRLATGEQHGGK
ncbi:MAG: hypothetical protein ACLFTT_08120 [Candidatus Hydrogenedentota bacterium]